jgi:hypothetical protein
MGEGIELCAGDRAVDLDKRSTVSVDEMAQLANAVRDVATISTSAEAAANHILLVCERLIAVCDKETANGLRGAAEDAAIEIMTACSFHDLIGQRARAVTGSLETVLAAWLKRLPEGRRSGATTSDAAIPPGSDSDERLSQDLVDALLAEEK